MIDTVRPPITSILTTCISIISTRGTPESLPYSRTLFQVGLGLAILAGLLNRMFIPGVELPHALINAAGEYAILLFGLQAILGMKEMPERFLKIATALVLISAIGGTALFLLRWVPAPTSQFFVTLVFVAQLSGALTALRRGMDVNWVVAGLYLFAYLWVAMLFFSITASMMDAQTVSAATAAPLGRI